MSGANLAGIIYYTVFVNTYNLYSVESVYLFGYCVSYQPCKRLRNCASLLDDDLILRNVLQCIDSFPQSILYPVCACKACICYICHYRLIHVGDRFVKQAWNTCNAASMAVSPCLLLIRVRKHGRQKSVD